MRGRRQEHDPDRQVSRPAFGIGDTIHVPGHGAFQVDNMGKRYFTGANAQGDRLGRTSIALTEGHSIKGPPEPWKIERTGSIPEAMVQSPSLGGRPAYGASNTFSGLRQAENDAQNYTRYRPSEYDDYDYG